MSGFNGAGLYVRYFNWVNDANNSINITASRMDTDSDGFATGLSTCICKDGQQTTTARIPFAVGLSVNQGSAPTPSISIIGDEDTGFYQSSGGKLRFSSNGVDSGIVLSSAGITAPAGPVAATTLTVTTSIALNTNKFTVNVSGNTVIAGTLAVTGNTVLSGTLQVGSKFPILSIVRKVITVSTTLPPTTGMVYWDMETLGGGGAGGGVASSSGVGAAGGGGAGSYSRRVSTAATVGASQVITIGAGGTAGSAGNNPGGNGGDTSVGALCIGKGGTGGSGAAANGSSAGGAGGVAGTGDFTPTGVTGFRGLAISSGYSGRGGSSLYGGGGVEVISSATGIGASLYGSGGSGGLDTGATANRAGGAGSAGVAIITEYIKV